jgi:hypothetical protein
MEKIFEIKLTEEEKAQFAKTVASVSKTVSECKL